MRSRSKATGHVSVSWAGHHRLPAGGFLHGRSQYDSPEVDQRSDSGRRPRLIRGCFYQVRITAAEGSTSTANSKRNKDNHHIFQCGVIRQSQDRIRRSPNSRPLVVSAIHPNSPPGRVGRYASHNGDTKDMIMK